MFPLRSSRFNVAITRAKALLIVVGNPKILWLDEHWKELIQSCLKNGTSSGLAEKHRFCYSRFEQIHQKLDFNRQIFFQMLQNGIQQILCILELNR
jgi:hypothetical protein